MSPVEELADLVWGQLHALAPLTGLQPDEIADRIAARCQGVVVELLSDDARLAAEACLTVMVVAPDDDPEWWVTSLGRLCARSLDSSATLTRREAAELLGVTPGTVAQLAARGTLTQDADGHVVVASVLARIDGRP